MDILRLSFNIFFFFLFFNALRTWSLSRLLIGYFVGEHLNFSSHVPYMLININCYIFHIVLWTDLYIKLLFYHACRMSCYTVYFTSYNIVTSSRSFCHFIVDKTVLLSNNEYIEYCMFNNMSVNYFIQIWKFYINGYTTGSM